MKMSVKIVVEFAKILADEFGITGVDKIVLMKNMSDKHSVPTIIRNNGYQFWIDKYYIAYSETEEQLVHYAYIQKNHVSEELRDIPNVIAKEKNPYTIYMLQDIQKQLQKANTRMCATGNMYYIPDQFKSRFENFCENKLKLL